jgi:hypothetical protein
MTLDDVYFHYSYLETELSYFYQIATYHEVHDCIGGFCCRMHSDCAHSCGMAQSVDLSTPYGSVCTYGWLDDCDMRNRRSSLLRGKLAGRD